MFHGINDVRADWHVLELSPVIFTRIYYVFGGDVVYRDRMGTLKLEHGHAYLFPTSEPYEMVQDTNNCLECFYCHKTLAPLVVPRLIDLDTNKDCFVGYLCKAMVAETEREALAAPENSMEIGMIVEELASVLLRYVGSLGLLKAMPPELSQAVEYIHGNYMREISVDSLAELAGYHQKYFIRKFRECTGMSPHSYLIHCRLEAACTSLLGAKGGISQVAESCGYPDTKSFSRAFKKQFGVPPGKFSRNTKLV